MTAAMAQTPLTPLKRTLPNGLTVLVLENHAAPVVAVRAYVKTGSIYEGQYLGAGISHLFEHTLSEGTTTRSKQQINDEVQAIGGQSNAYTSKDVTAYHITTAATFFDRALNSLADMLRNADFPEVEVKTQQGVIHNEMNLGKDDPDRVLYDLFTATAFRVHPVRYPIIGYRELFDRLTQADIVNYYKTHYTPENTVISIAGDVTAARTFEAVVRALGDWPRRTPVTPVLPQEPLQTTPRRAVIEKDGISQADLMMGWHTIPLQHPDLYALDTLAQILGGGESSRLVRELQEEKNLVSSISAYSHTPDYDAGVFGVRATLPAANRQVVEDAIYAQVEKVQRDGVTWDELKTARRQIEATFIFNNNTVEDQAEQIAFDEMGTGDPTYSRRYVSRIQAVTPEQVRTVARQYLYRGGATTAVLLPRIRAAKAATNHAQVQARAAVKPPQMITLSNGMRLVIRENHTTPTVAIVAASLGGSRLEPGQKTGVANLSGRMLTRGTTRRSSEQIAAVVDKLGGSMEGFGGYNAWGIQSRWLARDWRSGLNLVQESLLNPTFPADELVRLKSQVAAAIQQQEDDPMGAASLLLRRTFFGNHPYGRSSLGTVSSLAGISREDVLNYWRTMLLPRDMVLTVYGDINAEEVRRVAEYAFKDFKREGALPKPTGAPAVLTKFTRREQSKSGLAQAALFFGYPGINVRNNDRYAIDVLDAALSGSDLPGGRLHARLRDNQLVYVVHAFSQPGLDPGMFVVYAATTRDKLAEVQRIIQEEMERVRTADIGAEELARAKSMAIAAQAIDNQTNMAQAMQAALDELYGLGYNDNAQYETRIRAVTIEDVRRVAQKYLRPEAAALAIVQPA
jgi:zinc protease